MPTYVPTTESVTSTEANRNFSKLLRKVREGGSVVVTSHGQPIARLQPYEGPSPELIARRRAHLEELSKRPAMNAGPWTREELHDE